ncbi:hypothetical protein AO382_2123 [Moraxella catarrhalis]|uniref:Uncharacterized protein n=1 Tax=Moraxella catarrhalis TaxID=480 RepID=A0A7Z1A2W1_MORCA|nr:hypothetical protein AO382_2123 [Moraxella catarrhalis]
MHAVITGHARHEFFTLNGANNGDCHWSLPLLNLPFIII